MTDFSEEGWLYSSADISCRWRRSPHRNPRPEGCSTDLVVVHGISLPAGAFGGPWVDALFMRTLTADSPDGLCALASLEVSTHFFINRQGLLTQYVSILDRAWHAGLSRFEGRSNCNDFSLGIELEGTDLLPYTEAQMQALSLLSQALARGEPAIRAVTGHSHIAPGRKTDPGPYFDWHDLAKRLTEGKVGWRVVTGS
jgi:AmpD protein